MDQQKEKSNISKVKSPVKRNSKFTNRSSRENDKKRKKFIRDNFDEDEKEQLKKDDKKRKREMRDNFEEEKKNIQNKRIPKEKKLNVITSMVMKKNI